MASSKSPKEMIRAIIDNLPAKTGRTLQQWIAIARTGPGNRAELHAWLKKEHGLGHNTAGIVTREAIEPGSAMIYNDSDALVSQLFSGRNADLRPLHDRVIEIALGIGPDVIVKACRTYVGLTRRRQFAILKPASGNRIDIGLALPGIATTARLELPRGLGASERITHRVRIATVDEVDAEVANLLAMAYELDA